MRVKLMPILVLAAFAYAADSPDPAVGGVSRIYTVAGAGTAGDGAPAALARVDARCLAVLADGSVLVSGGARVRRIGRDGLIETVAGTGRRGFSGDGGAATRARIAGCDVAGLPGGGILLADTANNRLRRVDRHGVITTVAGIGEPGFRGDHGPARSAHIELPRRVSVRPDGSVLLLAGDDPALLLRIGRDGRLDTLAGAAGACSTAPEHASTGVLVAPGPIAPAAGDGFLLADDACVLHGSADGRITVSARGTVPEAVAAASDGGVLVISEGEVRRVDRDGAATVVAGCRGSACTSGDGPARTVRLPATAAIASEPDGGLLLADAARVARVDPAGMLTTLAPVGGVSLAREPDGDVLIAHPEPTGNTPGGTVLRLRPGGGTTVVAGGGLNAARVGAPAIAAKLRPTQVQALADGFALLDADRQDVVTVDAAGAIVRVVHVGGGSYADGFVARADGTLIALRGGRSNGVSRVQRLHPDGAWTTLASAAVAPHPGVPATRVKISSYEGFAVFPHGRSVVPTDEGTLWIGRDGAIERRRQLGVDEPPLASGPGRVALFGTGLRVKALRANGSVAALAGGGEDDGGFFGTVDGQPALSVDLAVGTTGDVAGTRGGGVLLAQTSEEGVGRVLWVAPERTRRLAVALTRRSLRLLRRHEVSVRTTVPARILLTARRGGRVVGRTRAVVRAGEHAIPLPRDLGWGEATIAVRAAARGHQQAWTQHRFLIGPRLPLSTARRLADGVACRRHSDRRVACASDEVFDGSEESFDYCAADAVVLKRDGVVYLDEYAALRGRCTHSRVSALLARRPDWGVALNEAPPL
jgi:hypothetical protein